MNVELVRRQENRTAVKQSENLGAPFLEPKTPALRWQDQLGTAPWWFVSCAMHCLIIALASLITMAIELPSDSDAVIMMTELQARPEVKTQQEEVKKPAALDVLVSKEVPATDPAATTPADIVVPPDILAKAELGDHFETINPELPDTHSALGNPDSKSFHSVEGNTEAAGGGGMGGLGMDDLIGVGGAASKGSGGGFGGGDGTGIGTQTGAGKSPFGRRVGGGRKLMVKRGGGSAQTEDAVNKALEWLARHQEADGHWNTAKFQCKGTDTGPTGLALLAFLGAGHTEKIGQYRDNVRRAVAWIISKQDANGSIGKGENEYCHPGYAYHHAICGIALAEAAGMAHIPATVEAAQKAVNYTCEKHQGGEGSEKTAWRYEPKVDADSSVSGWFVMQLKSAKIAGLAVDPASFEGALKFFDECEDKKDFNGYKGGRFSYCPHTSEGSLVNTSAIGTLCNLFLGRKPSELTGGAEYLSENLPKWEPTTGKGTGGYCFPMYYTYYGTLAMFQLGGDYWRKWNAAMKDMLLPHQCKDGDEAGSWAPLGGLDDGIAGRVYMTAMGALSLEVYYRYMRVAHE
jgi:hypothetical protein